MARLVSLVSATLLGLSTASVNFRGSGQLGRAQVEAMLTEELVDKDHRLQRYEDEMRQMFGALPKNGFGNLGHDALRSALHRFFVKRHGWYLHGLEPGVTVVEPENNMTLSDKDRIPVLVQENFERRTAGRGAALHDAAAIAAAIEDLIRRETDAHLSDAYAAAEVPPAELLTYTAAFRVSKVYFMSFLLEHNWTIENSQDLRDKEAIFEAKYPLYREAMTWLNSTVASEFGSDERQPVTAKVVTKVANKVGEEYHTLNDGECADLRGQLQKMESKVPGRIRLSVFYNMSLHSHWKFNEKEDILRALGVLDESDPNQKSVIISNYATAKPNCVNASNIYDICCRNTCEDIMTRLEGEVGATASPKRLAQLVASIPSESTKANRELPATLLQRLDEVAAHHGGQVPLHGRLFAQWLHHAYPLECPFPHEAGVTNGQLWTGSEEDQASEAEMKKHVEADTCAVNWEGKIDCGEESKELPWSMSEHLLSAALPVAGSSAEEKAAASDATAARGRTARSTSGGSALARLLLGLVGLAAAASVAAPRGPWGPATDLQVDAALRRAGLQRWHLAVAVLAVTAYGVGLLDPMVLAIASLAGLLAKVAVPKMGRLGDAKQLPTQCAKVV